MSRAGPILVCGTAADAVLAAIRRENDGVTVVHRGAYLRVGVPGLCTVTRAAIEAELGEPFPLPGALERIMPSFAGELTMTESHVEWRA